MLVSTFQKNNIEKCPFTYWLNGWWFLQIVERDSCNLYPIYPLFIVLILYLKCGGGLGGGGGVMFFSYFMLFTTFLEKNNLAIHLFIYFLRKTIISHLMFSSYFIMLEILKNAPSLTG